MESVAKCYFGKVFITVLHFSRVNETVKTVSEINRIAAANSKFTKRIEVSVQFVEAGIASLERTGM